MPVATRRACVPSGIRSNTNGWDPAVSGAIGFIGLVCPHLARLIVGNDQRKLLPLATALGASLLCVADAASRVLAYEGAAGTALPVGVLTGLLGGPFFLLLLWRNARSLATRNGG